MSPSLHQRLHERLLQLHEERPDLEAALDLQRNLLARELELTEVFLAGGLPRLSLPARYLAAKLGNGIPALHGEPVPLPQPLLALAVRDFCERLNTGRTAGAAQAIQAAFDGQLDPASVISACFGRDQNRVRALAEHASVTPDLLWLVAELSVAPLAHLLQRNIFGDAAVAAGTPLGDALARWDRGFCPACGSWPALMEAGEAGHTLRCSFCAAAWDVAGRACLFCGESGETLATLTPDASRPGRTVDLCGTCRGYVKTVDSEASLPFPLGALADLESMDLDLAAMQHGCARPTIKPFPRR